ncbi:MAG: hypothetical protein ACLPIC_06250 [Rhodoblastus sp.]|uniref:hypothetical protein n=1 Tax=Rhodoblastus sp. TaxID=1962975 RepID=UPI003F9DF6F1
MRDLLTYLGIALILALTAAVAAPFFIDFDAYRGRIAEELSAGLGAQVTLNGPISLRLLPTPRFSAEKLRWSGDWGSVKANKGFFELTLPGLIGGRLQFSRTRLDDCEIIIETQNLGAAKNLPATQFDDLVLHRATVTFLRDGAPALRLENLELAGNAPSLAGPFSARGSFPLADKEVAFTFASDVLAKDLLPLKANLTLPGESGRLELDGRLDFAAAPLFAGEAKAEGRAGPGPWRAQVKLAASFEGVEGQDFSATLGDRPLANRISGGGRYDARNGKISLDLVAPQIDAGWAELFSGPLLAASASAAPLDLRLKAETVNWRGADWTQVEFSRASGSPAHLQAQGPGASRLDFVAAPDGPGWRGKAQFKAEDFPAFAAALPQAAPLADFRLVEIGGDFSVSADEWSLTGARLALDRARLTGDLHFKPGKPDRRPYLAARLAAPALDLDAAPDLGPALLAGMDLDLALQAQTVKLAHGGRQIGEAGRIDAHFQRDGEATRLERLDLHNIGGAELSAHGGWGRDFSGLTGEARLKAADFSQLAQVLGRLFPGAATKILATRARLLSPADLTAKAGAAEKTFELNGALGGTKISASFAPRAGEKFVAALDLAAPDGGILLNQLGAPLLFGQKLGPAHVTARAQSAESQGEKLEIVAAGDLAGLHGDFRGFATEILHSPTVEGDLAVAGDATKILASFSPSPPAPIAARFSASLHAGDGSVTLHNLAGSWGDDKFAGDLTIGGREIVGDLRCDRLSAPALAALVLGPPAPAKTGALWSSLSFAPVAVDPPATKISVETANLQPFGGKARFNLTLGQGLLSLAQASLDISGGILRGGFDLRREDGRVSLSGEAEAENIALRNRGFSAKLDGRLRFAGDGANAAALLGSLAGSGAARAKNLVVAGAAEGAPDLALAASETSEAPFDVAGITKNLDEFFARGETRLGEADFAARLAAGRLNLTRANGLEPALEFSFDLSDASMALVLSMEAQKRPDGWTAPLPRAGVTWAGPWSAPGRRVAATGFVNAVATRALEREQARIEKLKLQDQERLRALAPQQAQ